MPDDVIEVTNVSDENVLLDLYSGLLRVDAGRTVRLTASALASTSAGPGARREAQGGSLIGEGNPDVQPEAGAD